MRHHWPFLCLFICILTACEIFSTREPEPPEDPRTPWIPPLSPEQVLINLQTAVSGRHVENYVRCFVNSSFSDKRFYFEPDPEVAANYAEIFLDWDLDKEEAVMQQAFALVPADSSSFLLFTEDIREVIASDSTVMVKQYRLELHHIQTGMSNAYEGQMEIWLAPDQRGEWSIYRWIDNGILGDPPWSLLKASLGG